MDATALLMDVQRGVTEGSPATEIYPAVAPRPGDLLARGDAPG